MDRLADLLEQILEDLKTLNEAVSRIEQQSFETGLEMKDLQKTIGGELGYNMQDLHDELTAINLNTTD